MKLTITTDSLKKALARLGVVPGILNTQLATLIVVIEADDFAAKIRRTTGNASISVDLEAMVDDPGQCGVGFNVLQDAINAMPGSDTTLESDGKILTIRSNKTKAELNECPEAELLPAPAIEMSNVSDSLDFLASDLVKWLKIAFPAAATDVKETKFAGVCMRVQQHALTLFGVDRRRVHIAFIGPKREALNPNGTAKDHGHMLLSDGVAALLKLLPDHEGKVELHFTTGALLVKTNDIEALLPMSEDQPPDLDQAFCGRVEQPTRFTCKRAELLRAARTAAPLGFQEQKIISIKLTSLGVEVVADNQVGGKLGHEIDAAVSGDDQHLRCNAQYFAEIVEAIEGDDITMNYWSDRNQLYAYMPDRLCVLMLVRDAANS